MPRSLAVDTGTTGMVSMRAILSSFARACSRDLMMELLSILCRIAEYDQLWLPITTTFSSMTTSLWCKW